MFGLKYRWVFMLLLAVYSYLNILFTEGDRLFGFDLNPWYLFLVLLGIVILIWESNRWLERILPNITLRVHPLVLLFGASLFVLAIIALMPTFLFMKFLGQTNETMWFHYKLALGFGFRVNLFLHCINAIIFYMSQFKNAQIEAERLKKVNMEAQFEALRNQINPHFLFNSFNVLSTLVYKDADTAAEFIQQLAKVYRYLIYHQTEKLVPLHQELDFIDAYLYLLQIRFADNLSVKIAIDPGLNDTYIAPVTLQMLIENAIKHNEVSLKNPLHIEICNENLEHLVISNNLQTKETEESSTGIGLRNIKDRYKFLSNLPVQIVHDHNLFSIKLPLITLSPNENIDSGRREISKGTAG